MTFVVDASVTICWLMPDERHPVAAAAQLKMASEPVVAPSIWWFETRNIILVNERRGRLDSGKTTQALGILAQLPITVDTNAVDDELTRLARHHRLAVYDAAYLELAIRGSHALATLDKALLVAAEAESVPVI